MIVPTKLESFDGSKIKPGQYLPTQTHSINNIMRKSKLVSGLFATIAILFSTGCANLSAPHRTMNYNDLEWFVVDCRQKRQQIAMLQAMRPTRDEKLFARLNNELLFWEPFTNPEKFQQRNQIASSRVDWLINQHLLRLRECY
jgi:hypothetical protein